MWSRGIQRTLMALASVFLLATTGCSDDEAQSSSCTFDSDCTLGTVCGLGSNTCVSASCDFCTGDQVCYITDANPEGSCSAPECASDAECVDKGGHCSSGICTDTACTSNAQCDAGDVCNLAGQCVEGDGTCASSIECPSGEFCLSGNCVAGCEADTACNEGEYCDTADHTCKAGCTTNAECTASASQPECAAGKCVCTVESCSEGTVCADSGACEAVSSCTQVICDGGKVCDPTTLKCIVSCTADSCGVNEACNTATGQCEITNCPGEDPSQCDGDARRPFWDPIRCFCAECLTTDNCDTGAGEICNSGGKCFACQTECDSGTPGTCQGTTPYCIDSCCVECVGAADCASGQLCLDGFCGQPPNCSTDPNLCPEGTECDATSGECGAPSATGEACDPADPASCPSGLFCDPSTSTCGGLGGDAGFGCGFCNADCTCDGGLTCDGMFCVGCSLLDPTAPSCPGGGFCLPDFNDPTGPGMCIGL